MFECWHMSIQMRMKAELINIVWNRWIHPQRSTLRRPRKIYWRRASPVRNVVVDDDAGAHASVPVVGWTGAPIRRVSVFCGSGGR